MPLTVQTGWEEQRLLARSVAGDVTAYEALVRRHQAAAFRLAYLISGNAADAEEAVQDAFVKAFRALPRFRLGSPFRPWLLEIAANEARNRRRVSRRQISVARRVEQHTFWREAQSAENAAAGSGVRRALVAALARLGDSDREIIACRYLLGLSEQETAAALDLRVGT